jgi:cytoskeletal protein CcmA (bactofilin family)
LSADPQPSPSPPIYKHEIAAGVTISGKLSFPGDARVDGKLRGEIRAHALLVVGASALLEADIRAQRLIVYGTVIGSIHVTSEVELTPGCRVIGDVEAAKLVVHEGAVLEGRCIVGNAAKTAVS